MEINKDFVDEILNYENFRSSIRLSNGLNLTDDSDYWQARREICYNKDLSYNDSDKKYYHLETLYRCLNNCKIRSSNNDSWSIFYMDPFTKEEYILPGAKYQLTFESKGNARKSLAQFLPVAKELIAVGCIQIKPTKLVVNDTEN